MAGLIGKIAAYARTPAGQRALRTAAAKAQQLAKDPQTRAKVQAFRQRRSGQAPPPGAGPTQP